MGKATKVLFETSDVTWKRSKDGGTRHHHLAEGTAGTAAGYSLVEPGSRRFLVNV